MKILQLFLVGLLLFSGCKKNEEGYDQMNNNPGEQTVKIKETIESKDYTYLRAEGNGKEIWLAVDRTDLKVGDNFNFSNALVMKNFKSKELNRVFDEILFVDSTPTMEVHTSIPDSLKQKKNRLAKEELSKIKVDPAPDGISIGDLYKNKAQYGNKVVTVRGKVVKVNSNIMDRNWVHLMDGTSFEDKSDLTFTTNETVKVDDVVTLKGTVALDKKYGEGYVYPLIVEGAVLKGE